VDNTINSAAIAPNKGLVLASIKVSDKPPTISKVIALKPSLAGEGGVRRNQKNLFFNILSLFVFKNKERKQKIIYFNASSPKPSPAREGLRKIELRF